MVKWLNEPIGAAIVFVFYGIKCIIIVLYCSIHIQISVVDERRLYTSWSDDSKTVPDAAHCNINTGIIKAKQILNELHRVMGGTGYNQVKLYMRKTLQPEGY